MYNRMDLDIESSLGVFNIFFQGLRFDLSAVLFSNFIFTFLFFLQFIFSWGHLWKNVLKLVFVFSNSFFIFLNFVDVVYFPFVRKRMQSDVFLFLNGEKGNEAFGMIPTFILQYWFVWILFAVIVYFIAKLYSRWERDISTQNERIIFNFSSFVGIIIVLAINITGMRGGLQLRPITILNASESVGVENAPAVLNSTFSLIRTWQKKSIQLETYFPMGELNECERGVHPVLNHSDTTEIKLNIVILIVESLSKQYMSYYGGTSQTPFLDSIMQHSLVFNHGFANARESVQGIPAILASIPSLMDEPFIFSRYSNNKINSMASILKNEGYTSAFFHGAATGTMGFHSFCTSAGFDHYFGKEDYENRDEDFDGSWGIWDHKYLPYMGAKLTELRPPFVASVLTLNSHHPFKLPDQFVSKYKSIGHPIISSIRYADYALSLFFETAQKEPWYENTLFVITADHTGPNTDVLKNKLDEYRIPIIFHRPDHSLQGVSEKIANQIDIMPTVLSYIKVKCSYFSLGNDLLENVCPGKTVNYKMGIYQYIDSTHCIQYDGNKIIGLFNWRKDKFLKQNLSGSKVSHKIENTMENSLKKTIQVFNQTMMEDQMIIKTNAAKK
jgi:phosphoglycerol transferase MdoB-like AlkP superfamily enzyme